MMLLPKGTFYRLQLLSIALELYRSNGFHWSEIIDRYPKVFTYGLEIEWPKPLELRVGRPAWSMDNWYKVRND